MNNSVIVDMQGKTEIINDFAKDVDEGLSSVPKNIPSKYFYDKKGDELFMKIMHLPEYYVTRAEFEIFVSQTNDIIKALDINKDKYFELIEFGAGDGLKTKELLRELDKQNYKFDYFPIDISINVLNELEKNIHSEFPNVSIIKKQGDYFQVLKSLTDNNYLKIVLFLGSNIGNMPDKKASEFIYHLGAYLNTNDKLFLGVDLIKEKSVVLPAYDDNEGVTRDFNLNLLERINSELGADFVIENFSHQPEYSEEEGVAKSYLVSLIDQYVYISAIKKSFHFKKGEKILTEISRKYNDEIINKIISNTDFKITKILTDSKKYFSNYILTKK